MVEVRESNGCGPANPVQELDIREYPHSGKNKVRCGQGAISRLSVPFTSRKCEPLMEGAVKHLAGGQVVCFPKGGSDSESFIILTINPPSLRLHLLHRKESAPAAMGTSGFTQDFSIRQIRSLLKVLHKSLHKPQTAWPVLQSFSPTPGLEHIQTCKVTKPLLHHTAPQAGNKQELSSVVVL